SLSTPPIGISVNVSLVFCPKNTWTVCRCEGVEQTSGPNRASTALELRGVHERKGLLLLCPSPVRRRPGRGPGRRPAGPPPPGDRTGRGAGPGPDGDALDHAGGRNPEARVVARRPGVAGAAQRDGAGRPVRLDHVHAAGMRLRGRRARADPHGTLSADRAV